MNTKTLIKFSFVFVVFLGVDAFIHRGLQMGSKECKKYDEYHNAQNTHLPGVCAVAPNGEIWFTLSKVEIENCPLYPLVWKGTMDTSIANETPCYASRNLRDVLFVLENPYTKKQHPIKPAHCNLLQSLQQSSDWVFIFVILSLWVICYIAVSMDSPKNTVDTRKAGQPDPILPPPTDVLQVSLANTQKRFVETPGLNIITDPDKEDTVNHDKAD